MFSNYLKIALRTLLKHKGFTSINLIGLSLGITAGIFILLYIIDESSFDRFHTKAERIYRINTTFYDAQATNGSANETNGWPIGKIIQRDFPEAEQVLYATHASFLSINHEGKRIRETAHFVSENVFEIFTFPLVSGNPALALQEPYTIVISRAMEEKYFPNQSALNKTLTFADTLTMRVTGVMENIPVNSHIQSNIFISFATYQKLDDSFSYTDGWGNINMHNYLLVKEGVNVSALAAKAKNIYMDNVADMMKEWGTTAYVELEPLKDIYLKSSAGNSFGPLGSAQRLYLLGGIALFVIVLACINFINLATARSVFRAKEVGLRKVVGSSRVGLIMQFLSESFVLTSISLLIALALLGILLPFFNQLLGKSYALNNLIQLPVLASGAILLLVISVAAGYYPALVISALRPAEVLKGKMQNSKRGVQVRRSLVVFQFVISAGLVAGTLVVINQLNFMQQQALGFNKDQVLVLSRARVNASAADAFQTFKNELKTLAQIKEVSYTNALPGTPGWVGQIAYPEGKSGDETVSVEYMAVDEQYIPTLDLELIAGRNFDLLRVNELQEGLILNETAVKQFGWNSPEESIGKEITSPSGAPSGKVIGVVKDYHQTGLQRKVRPITMDYAPDYSYLYAIKFEGANTKEVIASVNTLWQKNFPGYDFNYFFLDESFEKQYQAEERLANVLALFAITTILIASIGLIGLVSFMVVARTKEIGVRKILGADVLSLTGLLSKEFLILVFIANLIAFPLVWYFANEWLQSFAFRMQLSPFLFIITMGIAMITTLMVVSFQTLRAAIANPVNSLRYE